MGGVFRVGGAVPVEGLLGEGVVHRHVRAGDIPPQQLDRLPVATGSDEFRPFSRRLPEFQFWLSSQKGLLMAFGMTFFSIFDIPVFWPILLVYFIVLMFLTMKRQTSNRRPPCAGPAAAGSPTRRDVPYDIGECVIHSSFPPAPPPRALELVKEEVHRALEAFSTRPLKGEPSAPRPSDLLRPFDVSKDGRVTYRELQAGILGLGIGLTNHEARALARAVDREQSGLIDREKFEAAASQDWGNGGREIQGMTSAPARLAAESESFGSEDASPLPSACENRARALGGREEQQREEASRNRSINANCARADEKENADNEERGEQPPPPPPPPSERPKLLPQASRSDLATTNSRERSPATVSFDYWQRNRTTTRETGSEDNGIEASAAAALTATGPNTTRDGNINDACETPKYTNNRSSNGHNDNDKRSLSQKRANSLNTLRSLLREDGVFDYADKVDSGHYHRRSSFGSESGGWKRRDRRPQQEEQNQSQRSHEDQMEFKSARGRGGGDRRDNSGKAQHRRARDESGLASAHGGRRRQGTHGTGGDQARSADLERRQAIATRAESILRLRSRGDLVGLRRAMSKADPSASGVVSQREMERVVLRRFGTGLGSDEASELAARYRKEFNGRSMVDYDRLLDSLDVKEAGLFDQAVAAASSSPSTVPCSGRGLERGRGGGQRQQPQQQQQRFLSREREEERARPASMAAVEGSRRRGSSWAPPAAGARTRYSQRRYSRRGVPGFATDDLVGQKIPAEDSQLVRRARAKTLALLDRYGTRSVDCVFGLVDPGQTHSVSSRELREGLRILGGSDTLSQVEHQALFRDISKGHDRIRYKELLDTLRTAEAAENRERTQRKLAHQAGLPTSGRGSASHWRHSDVLDWDVPPAGGGRGDPSEVGLSGGRQHKESRREALVFERLRDSVRQIQEGRNSAGPVFDMFQQGGRGRGQETNNSAAASHPGGKDNADPDNGQRTPPPLSPAALRAGLGSLGVQLGDKDFVALTAATDPENRGEVSYPNFCEAFRLHRLRGVGGESATQRPSSAPPQRTSSRSTGGGGGGGGGYARRRAMELAPPADAQAGLEGGLFHVNPATFGCANPNFTTTMIPVGGRDGDGAWRSGPDRYRPKRRQSGDGAPTRAHKQTLLVVGGGDRVERWNETGAEAERRFRQGLGVKMRRSHSLSSCYARGRGGWDNLGTPSPRGGAPPPPTSSATTSSTPAAASWTDNNVVVLNGGSGNRRGRCYTPRNSDLGFGSERMRSQSRDYDDQGDHCRRRGRRISNGSGVADADSRRARSLSLGVERRYGDWARSSVQHLLRQDGWLGVRSPRPAGSFETPGELSAGHGSGRKDQRRRRAAAAETRQQKGRPRSSPGGGRVSNPNTYRDGPVVRNSARHPAQTRERRASPYATDADISSAASRLPAGVTRSSIAGRSRDSLSRTHPRRTVVDDRARNHSELEGWGKTVTSYGARAGGEFSPTLRWDESVHSPQERSGRQSARKGQAGAPSFDAKAASKVLFSRAPRKSIPGL
eukprot:g1367.t1